MTENIIIVKYLRKQIKCLLVDFSFFKVNTDDKNNECSLIFPHLVQWICMQFWDEQVRRRIESLSRSNLSRAQKE